MGKKLKVSNLTKIYGVNKALDDVSLEIEDNEFLAVIGNNGAGKSTLIKIICNLLTFDSGKIEYFDNSFRNIPPKEFKKKLGIILDKSFLIEELTTIEYLTFISKFHDIPEVEVKSRIHDLIEILNIENHKKPIEKLSSGNKIKVAFAAALIHNPDVLILDEPFVNLDINTIETILNILDSFKGKKTIIISSHNLDLVVDTCERFLIIDKGTVIEEFRKQDYNGVTELKSAIKKAVVIEKKLKDYNWLN